jgi:hypothetical protein
MILRIALAPQSCAARYLTPFFGTRAGKVSGPAFTFFPSIFVNSGVSVVSALGARPLVIVNLRLRLKPEKVSNSSHSPLPAFPKKPSPIQGSLEIMVG